MAEDIIAGVDHGWVNGVNGAVPLVVKGRLFVDVNEGRLDGWPEAPEGCNWKENVDGAGVVLGAAVTGAPNDAIPGAFKEEVIVLVGCCG